MNHHDGREPLGLRLATTLQYSAYDKGERYADGSTQDGHKKLPQSNLLLVFFSITNTKILFFFDHFRYKYSAMELLYTLP